MEAFYFDTWAWYSLRINAERSAQNLNQLAFQLTDSVKKYQSK